MRIAIDSEDSLNGRLMNGKQVFGHAQGNEL